MDGRNDVAHLSPREKISGEDKNRHDKSQDNQCANVDIAHISMLTRLDKWP
jgi:hypothetical protein